MIHGHGGVVIGSEMSGGVRGVVDPQLRLPGHRPRHPDQVASRTRRHGRGRPRDEHRDGRRDVPAGHQPLLLLRPRREAARRVRPHAAARRRGDASLPRHPPVAHHRDATCRRAPRGCRVFPKPHSRTSPSRTSRSRSPPMPSPAVPAMADGVPGDGVGGRARAVHHVACASSACGSAGADGPAVVTDGTVEHRRCGRGAGMTRHDRDASPSRMPRAAPFRRRIELIIAGIGLAASAVLQGGFAFVIIRSDDETLQTAVLPALREAGIERVGCRRPGRRSTPSPRGSASRSSSWRCSARSDSSSPCIAPAGVRHCWWFVGAGVACLLGTQLVLYPVAFLFFLSAALFAVRTPAPRSST